MKEKLLIEIPIPIKWTGEQAKAVWEFLETLETAVFEAHEAEILEVIEDENLEAEIKKNRKKYYNNPKKDIFPF